MTAISKNTFVSVIIPVHNRPEELRRAIRSALAQTHANLEVLVMDDASTVDLKKVVDEIVDTRIRFFRQDSKSNANVLRNQGIREAKGEIVALLDSDDEFLPQHIENKLEILASGHAQAVYGSAFIDDGSRQTYAPSREMVSNLSAVEFLLTIGFAQTSSWLVLKSCALEVMFDETLQRHQDYDFFVRFSKKFNWANTWNPGTIIHWKAGEKRQRHPGSEIEFIQRNVADIKPRIYADYHLTRLGECIGDQSPQALIDYYRRESERFIMQLSFLDFCSMYPHRKGFIGFVLNWLHFNGIILARKFSHPKPPIIPKF
jgi:glycosyltransferase involved in cell wall biosynthesis